LEKKKQAEEKKRKRLLGISSKRDFSLILGVSKEKETKNERNGGRGWERNYLIVNSKKMTDHFQYKVGRKECRGKWNVLGGRENTIFATTKGHSVPFPEFNLGVGEEEEQRRKDPKGERKKIRYAGSLVRFKTGEARKGPYRAR